MVLALSIVGTITALSGNVLVVYKKRMGWLIWLLSNVFWVLVNFAGEMNVPMVMMYLVYAIINVTGFIKWGRKEK